MYEFRPLTIADITPRILVLSVLNSLGTERQTIAQLIKAASAFDIEPTALRVAVTRLIKEGLLESPERGVYVGGARARRMTAHVRNWQTAADAITDWNGHWLVNLTHHLGRTDRKQLRHMERAMSLFGYRYTDTGLWVRPSNLATPLTQHRDALIELGADEGIITLDIAQAEADASTDWNGLWSADALATNYRAAIQTMEDSLSGLHKLPLQAQARDTLLIGQAVIRQINLDPLLPRELCDHDLFLQMVDGMKVYNRKGRAVWKAWRDTIANGSD